MEGDRKKRKIDTEPVAEEEEEEEESEEEKMEKFFALIQSTREARGHLRGGGLSSSEGSEKSREDRRKAREDQPRRKESAWMPAFRPEDFSQDPILNKSSTTPSTPDVPSSSGHEARAGPSTGKQDDERKDDEGDKKKREKDGDDDNGDEGLNLKLSL
ncbi:uncharacterized protein J3R85_014574 [Psidium guajava]|nr:uncharacterized protein J3R85_014574 [Psidium guajava]